MIIVTARAYALINVAFSFLKNKIGSDKIIGKKMSMESMLFNVLNVLLVYLFILNPFSSLMKSQPTTFPMLIDSKLSQ